MDENHQDKTESKPIATEDDLWLPPLSPQDQKKLDRFRKKRSLRWTRFFGKTFREWLQLVGVLLIPLVVAGATLLFSIQQANLANQQRQADNQRAIDQQQATILQTYIDNIQDLLLNHNLLKSSTLDQNNPYYDVAILARARTLTALQGLDPKRKGLLLTFLYQARLIGSEDIFTHKYYAQIIDLSDADLTNAILSIADLSRATLSRADLSFANLSEATLYRANLSRAKLSAADLSAANLSEAYLSEAGLFGANLSGATLHRASLIGADLSGANLSGTTFITKEQLKEPKSLKDTIMPDGNKNP